jgi:hypothetical protein
MKNNKIRYEDLQRVLLRLGYTAIAQARNRVVYRHPENKIEVFLRRMRRTEFLKPIDLLSVQNTLAYSGMVPKEEFDSLFHPEPIELWHAIIDAEAQYQQQHGHPASVLKLPVPQAYDLAKLRRKEFGPLAERVMQEGIKIFEKEGLPGLDVPVELVQDASEFIFE